MDNVEFFICAKFDIKLYVKLKIFVKRKIQKLQNCYVSGARRNSSVTKQGRQTAASGVENSKFAQESSVA